MKKPDHEVIKSTCTLCPIACGVLIHMVDGTPVKVEGDPDHPSSQGAICIKGKTSLEYLRNRKRLKYPLKRIGEKGSGTWRRISWDEALETISTKLGTIKDNYGPEAVAFVRGRAKGYPDRFLARFANVYGSPNVVSTSNVCFIPRLYASMFTYGFVASADYEHPPQYIVLWGTNCIATNILQHRRIEAAIEKGTRLIVIDPLDTVYTGQAEMWAKLRPGSDLVLALGMINVIIDEQLYDKDFVSRWTVGFDELVDSVRLYTPEKVSELTWVPAPVIVQIARLYATNKPACIEWGNGLDTNVNSFQAGRAIAILRAITGNLGNPGSELEWLPVETIPETAPELNLPSAISQELRAKRIGAEEHILPTYFSALPQKMIKAMLTSDPYPIRAAYITGAAMLHSYSNVQEVYQALKSLDFCVVADLFMIPTAELADIVLPVTTFLEMDGIYNCPIRPAVSIIQKVAQVGECWSDLKIYNELSKRMGFSDFFWDNEIQTLDYLLQPVGIAFEEFRTIGAIPSKKQYRSYEKKGFNTASGKVELYSEQLKEWGFNPLPIYKEPPETIFSAPDLAKEYPLTLTSNKLVAYTHSNGRQISALRKNNPEPLVTIHKDTAIRLNIKEGDWVYIETTRGKIKHKVVCSVSIDPRVVNAEHGWWFPEKDARDNHGWAESNINILTDSNPPYGEIGSLMLRGILCRVSKVESNQSE